MKTKLVYVLLGCLFASCTNKTIAFRCDDIRLDLDSQNVEMLRLFDKYDMHMTCAVIPFDKQGEPLVVNNEALEYLKYLHKKGNVEIALHGYKHCWTGNKGELDGLPYEEQYAMLSAGKHLLDSVFATNVVSFVPPRNWYDENTILALDRLGFENISACAENDFPLYRMTMNQMPFSCGELRLLTQELRHSWGVMVLMYHPFEFTDSCTLIDLEENLIYCSENNIQTMTISELAKQYKFDLKRIKWNKEHNLLTNTFPSAKRWSYTYSPLYICVSWLLNILLYWIPIGLAIGFGDRKKKWLVISEIVLGIAVSMITLLHIAPLKLWCMTLIIGIGLSVISRLRIKCRPNSYMF